MLANFLLSLSDKQNHSHPTHKHTHTHARLGQTAMVQLSQLDHLEYREAILDSPEFREKLKKHEKYILDTSKNIKVLLKKFEDVITASETLKNAQDTFSVCLKEFQIGFVGDTNEEESDIVDTLDSTYFLVQDIKDFSTKMIDTGNSLFKQLDHFRKEKINQFKERKKEYERQTVKYCTTLDKYLASSQSSKKDKNNEEVSDYSRENDKDVRDENNLFYRKCLEYVLCIQEFEEKWFHFFAESLFAFIQSWTTFYHEGYEKHLEFDPRFSKSHRGIQALSNNFDYFKSKSSELIVNILKDPEYFINSYDTSMSLADKNKPSQTCKQGYLYLLEKKALGSSARVKQFCKYYKDTKKLEVTPYNQLTNKYHQPEVYFVNNCQKSSIDKRFVFDVSLRDKGFNNVHTYQATSYEEYKAWFAIMEGKELTPVMSTYSNKTEPSYVLDKNGINFIKRCTSLLEDDKLNEEGIYRKNGVSHKINQFIERNFSNISQSMVDNNNHHHQQSNGHNQDKSLHLSHSSSSSTLSLITNTNNNNNNHGNFLPNHASNNNNNTTNESLTLNQLAAMTLPSTPILTSSSSNISRNNSNLNLANGNSNNNNNNSLESDDTCTITSALKHYLIHLKEPLMTYSYNQQFLNTCKIENISERITEIHKLLNALPAYNREAIEILMKHLFKVSTHSLQNKMTTSNLATCLGPTVFRTEQESVSNLYNIKFYSEIIELLIVHHENIFQPTLDSTFLSNLIPLKSPPTMMSSAVGLNNSGNSNSLSPFIMTTPIIPSNIKTRIISNITTNSQPTNNRRGVYEPTYRQTLINSSKTSVSSDSSQSDKEQQLINTSNFNLNQNISSPILTSSPSNNNYSNNRISIIHNPNNVSNHFNNSSTSPTSNATITNVSIPIQKSINIVNNNNNNTNKPYKPFNSQTGPFNQRENGNSAQQIKTSNTNTSINSNNSNSRSSTLSLNSNLSIPQPNAYTKINSNSSPSNIRTIANNSQNSSSPSLLNNLILSPQPDSSMNTKFKRARTLYPCEADNPSELSFEANVIISNVRRSKESGWLEGTYNGKSGLVPGNYVQILDD